MTQTTHSSRSTHDPERRPVIPPEWTPPPGTLAVPPRPERPATSPSLPMILTPEPVHDDIAEQLLRRRIVMLTGPLSHELADDVTARLLLLDQQSSEPITMHVSSADADLDAAVTVVATIDLVHSDVTAIAAGTVEGAAVAVYAAAAHRIAHPHATFVLREPRAELHGDADRLAVAAEQHRRQVDRLCERIAAATGRSSDGIARDMEQGRLLTAEEALGYGLVQELTPTR
jgi:ATP-dependent Clp protease protease subunit